ncbi:MAG: site-specific tyrosine recombinase [Bacteroidales bacterium]
MIKTQEERYIKKYYTYLKFEKNLLPNSIEAYISDVTKLKMFACDHQKELTTLSAPDITEFLCELHEIGIHPRSQARILSGIKSFYKFLLLDGFITVNPTDLIEGPKIGRKLPEILSVAEIDLIIQSIDVSTSEGQRNRAILETLYSCGIRVSELTGLRISQIYKNEGFIMVQGKGDKQRIVPIADTALSEIEKYMFYRNEQFIRKGNEDILFINRLGTGLSRVMIFNIIRKHCELAGIRKNVSPHTFRHSFATHLLEGGSNLRAIQLMLGHEKIATTEIYTHIDRQFLREEILTYHPRNKR